MVLQTYQFIVEFGLNLQIKRLNVRSAELDVAHKQLDLQAKAAALHLVKMDERQYLYDVQSQEIIKPLLGQSAPNQPEQPSQLVLADSLKNDDSGILLGYTPNGLPIIRDISRFCHFLAVGQSGSGKSVLALAMASAAIKAGAELCLIDIEGITFNAIKGAAVATSDSVDSAKSLLKALCQELEIRKGLFSQFPLVDKLSEYNALAGNRINPRVLFVDEFTSLMVMDKTIESDLRNLLLRGRKYGLFVFAFGQSAKADVLDTTLRGQFATRVLLRTEDGAARVVLGDMAKQVDNKRLEEGEGYVVFNDLADPVKFKGVYRSKQDIYDEVAMVKPQTIIDLAPKPDEFESQVLSLADSGKSVYAICKAMGLNSGGEQSNRIKAIIAKYKK
jgi:DNA segregation ATPase FtsK/SpoIIIE-like protein